MYLLRGERINRPVQNVVGLFVILEILDSVDSFLLGSSMILLI